MLFEVCFTGRFLGVPSYSVRVRADSERSAIDKGALKVCKLLRCKGFYRDSSFSFVGGFYKLDNGGNYSFLYGSASFLFYAQRARYAKV